MRVDIKMQKNNKDKQQQDLGSKQQALREFNAFIQNVEKESGTTSSLSRTPRSDMAPPPEPIKGIKNPDGIVDVITFCEHPHFLNLRLTPWQRLILKLFYCGTEGNTHLTIDDTRTETCDGCVWQNNCHAAEMRAYDDIMAKKSIPYSYLPPENSPCLTCNRFSDDMRETKYGFLLRISLTDAIQAKMQILKDRPLIDNFLTEKDMFENDLEDEVREQIRGKIGLPFQELILVLGRRSGKALALDTPIITPDGWKTMGELNIGDYVFGSDGLPTKIIATSEIMTNNNCYELTFSNGDKIIADENHDWYIVDKWERKNSQRDGRRPVPKIKTTREIAESIYWKRSDGKKEHINSILINDALVYPYPVTEFPIEPYVLGTWLADGCKTNAVLTSADEEIVNNVASYGYDVHITNAKWNKYAYRISQGINSAPLLTKIKKNGLHKNKHIPEDYFRATIENRLNLLQGLMDCDGSVDKHGSCEYYSSDKRLAEDVYQLVVGLGIKATLREKAAKLYGRYIGQTYTVAFTPNPGIPIFRLNRKTERLAVVHKSDIGKIFITGAKLIDPVPVKCIQVSNFDQTYLAGKSMIPTHNSFMVSVIALYEVYRLLMMGNPQQRYSLLDFDIITILNVASSEDTAKSAIFDKIKNLVETSPYFSQYLGKAPTSLKIYFLTPADIEENERRGKMGMGSLDGTIVLQSGHSNSATMVGRTVFTVIIDEMAAMSTSSAETEGVDEALYSMLKPSLATFGMQGKMICISNPLGPQGKFYKLYQNSFIDKTMLMLQLPTWLSNPTVPKEFLESEQLKDPTSFNMHYGAQFGVTGASPFLPEWSVNEAFDRGSNKRRLEQGYSNIQYFAHLDPAFSSDNYTLAVVHIESMPRTLGADGKDAKSIVVDHMMVWRPRTGYPIDSSIVDDYIIDLSNRFKFAQISYDHWGSQASISKLMQYGLRVVQKQFSNSYQNLIFSEMFDLFTTGRMDIYNVNSLVEIDGQMMSLEECAECKKQMLTLQKRWRNNSTYKVEALKGNHDDFPDCIAAAGYEALKFKEYQRLAKPKSIYTGPRFR